MLPSLNIFLGRSSQRPQVGVFSGPPFKPASHLGASLLFEDIKPSPGRASAPAPPAASPAFHTTRFSASRRMASDDDQSANRTFALVKPDALTPFKYQQIDALVKLNEFDTVRQKLVWLTDDQADALFPDQAANEDSHREWLEYITCAPCLAIELAKPDAPLFWQLTMGAEDPGDGSARDSDSIRGILAVDRIRNAVDGSQEPEDAVRQLALAFSDAVAALPYDNFLMQRADDAHSTLALIKPDVSRNEQAVARIIGRIVSRGYAVKDRVDITLSPAQAASFCAQYADRPFFDDLVAFMASGPVIALLLEGDDVIRGWRMMMTGLADPASTEKYAPQSLRALFGTDERQNAVHGSDSPQSAQRELGFFFFPRIQPDPEAQSEPTAVTDAPVQSEPAAVADAPAQDAAAGADDKKKKKKQKKRRNKRKQPVTANSGAPEQSAAGGGAAAPSDDSEDEPEGPAKTPDEDEDEDQNQDRADECVVELAQSSDSSHERTFALIKPDAYPRHAAEVVKQLLAKGLTVVAQEQVQLTEATAKELYSDMATYPVFSRLIEFVTSAPCLALVLEGAEAISVWRDLVGPKNPRTAKFEARGSLRAQFGSTVQKNAVHASKDLAEARRAIKLVFYDLLGGEFRTLEASDDPLAEHLAGDDSQPADEALATAPGAAVAGFEAVAEDASDAGEQAAEPANVEEEHLTKRMETLAVSPSTGAAAVEPVQADDASDEKAAAAKPADDAVDIAKDSADDEKMEVGESPANEDAGPQTAPGNDDASSFTASEPQDESGSPSQQQQQQARGVANEKPSPFGGRLAASPFLKADRQLGQDSTATPKRVGRIKSPFLQSSTADASPSPSPSPSPESIAVDDEDGAEPASVGAADSTGTRDVQLQEKMAGLRIEPEVSGSEKAQDTPVQEPAQKPTPEPEQEAEPEQESEPEQKSEPEVRQTPEPEQKAEQQVEPTKDKPEVGEVEAAAASTEKDTSKEEPAAEEPRATKPVEQPPASNGNATPPRASRAAAGSMPVPRTPVTRASAAAPARGAARSAVSSRTATRATGPRTPAAASPTAASSTRRATLGPSASASRARAPPATPTTPTVTTRSTARAARATPSSVQPGTSTPPRPGMARRPVASTLRSTPTARSAAAPTTPTRALGGATRTRTVVSAAQVEQKLSPATPGGSRASSQLSTGPASTTPRTRPSQGPPVTPTVGRRTAAAGSTPSTGTLASRRLSTRTPASAAQASPTRASTAAASPRPVTRSMTSGVPVATTAASRARAAAAARGGAQSGTPSSPARTTARPGVPRAAQRPAPPRATPTAASRARAAAKKPASETAETAEMTEAPAAESEKAI